MSWDVSIATHIGMPEGAPDDVRLAAALAELGASSRFAVWNAPDEDWSMSPITIVRSTWDYHRAPDAWLAWLSRASPQTRVVNAVELLRWNTDKRYLRTLHRAGIEVVPTIFVEHEEDIAALKLVIDHEGWGDIVVKPAIAASAFGSKRFPAAALLDAVSHATALLAAGAVLVQPFQNAVLTERERSLVMLGGQFSHAFTKPAFDPGAAAGRSGNEPWQPKQAELDLAVRVLSTLPTPSVYARVDLVPGPSGPLLMELELIEPHLSLESEPSAAARLADLILQPEPT